MQNNRHWDVGDEDSRGRRAESTEVPVLKHPHHRAEGRTKRKHIQHQRLQRDHHATGEQEQHREHDHRDKSEHHRQPRRDGLDAVAVDLRGAGEQHFAPAGTVDCVQAVELSIGGLRRTAAPCCAP